MPMRSRLPGKQMKAKCSANLLMKHIFVISFSSQRRHICSEKANSPKFKVHVSLRRPIFLRGNLIQRPTVVHARTRTTVHAFVGAVMTWSLDSMSGLTGLLSFPRRICAAAVTEVTFGPWCPPQDPQQLLRRQISDSTSGYLSKATRLIPDISAPTRAALKLPLEDIKTDICFILLSPFLIF